MLSGLSRPESIRVHRKIKSFPRSFTFRSRDPRFRTLGGERSSSGGAARAVSRSLDGHDLRRYCLGPVYPALPEAALHVRSRRPIDAPRNPSPLFLLFALALTSIVVAGCEVAWPAWRTLMPQSDFGRMVLDVYEDILWWSIGIFVVVEFLLLFAVIRFRRRAGDTGQPEQVHGYTALELGWTFVPAAILFFIAIPTVRTIFQTQSEPTQNDP